MEMDFDFDVFLSYHPNHETELIDELYDFLIANKLIVWKRDERKNYILL